MENWVGAFIIIAALAIALQAGILVAMFIQLRRTNERLLRIATDFQQKADPILSRTRILLDDVQPKLSSMATDAVEISRVAREQINKVDRLFTEALDRLRLQIIRVDQMLTGAMEHIEEAGEQVRKTVLGPVQQAAAILKGVQAGLEVLRGQRRAPERAREHQDEELFI